MDDDGSVPPDFLASGRLESAMRALGADLIGSSIGVGAWVWPVAR